MQQTKASSGTYSEDTTQTETITVGEDVPRKTKLVVSDPTSLSFYFDTARFEHAWRVATALSQSNLVPAHFQAQPSNCLIAMNFANSIKADPMMVMQRMPIVNGRAGMEAQLVLAAVDALKPFDTKIKWDITGDDNDPKSMACTAWAMKDGERVEYPLTWVAARKVGNAGKNANWDNLPRLMLMYRSATYLVRAYAPSVLMGMHTADELQDMAMIDVTPASATEDIKQSLKEEIAAEKKKPAKKTIIENAPHNEKSADDILPDPKPQPPAWQESQPTQAKEEIPTFLRKPAGLDFKE